MANMTYEPKDVESWGRIPKTHPTVYWHRNSSESLPNIGNCQSLLPYGLGRSYGDSCLNDNNAIVRTTQANKYISFDSATGILTAESGVTLGDILRDFTPRGWFLPTTPGTKFVTLGGAVANDVHGKNHHKAGTFGCHIKAFELLRSDGSRIICSREHNSDLFAATIGGLGLTGLITWVTLGLRKVAGPLIDQRIIKYKNLSDFFKLSEEYEEQFEFSVSWVDCTSQGAGLGRGLFMCGNHSPQVVRAPSEKKPMLKIPFDFPNWTLNSYTVKIFNALYYNKQMSRCVNNTVHFEPFFYPLDVLHSWNRIYGPNGFYQWQCVVPYEGIHSPISEILTEIAKSGNASFLAVLKTFGDVPSPGLLSFPKKGVTLALDFRNKGDQTLKLFDNLDAIVRSHGGRIYPAKDGRMIRETFLDGYPQWETFAKSIDPLFASSWSRRLGLKS